MAIDPIFIYSKRDKTMARRDSRSKNRQRARAPCLKRGERGFDGKIARTIVRIYGGIYAERAIWHL